MIIKIRDTVAVRSINGRIIKTPKFLAPKLKSEPKSVTKPDKASSSKSKFY